MTSNRIRNVVAAAVLAAAGAAHAQLVFSSDFDSGIAAAVNPGSAFLTGVQGYAGFGQLGNQFGGQFLRSATANKVTLTLAGLPAHDSLSIQFLFGAIDSLDGTGNFPSGDYFRIDIDGVNAFRESFANAADSQVQSYVPAPGAELARKLDLGFGGPGGFFRDSAYDLGADPRFQRLAHVGSTVTVEFWMEGEGLQSLDDESWAMDNLRVTAYNATAPVPEPSTVALMFGGLGALAWMARRRKTR